MKIKIMSQKKQIIKSMNHQLKVPMKTKKLLFKLIVTGNGTAFDEIEEKIYKAIAEIDIEQIAIINNAKHKWYEL